VAQPDDRSEQERFAHGLRYSAYDAVSSAVLGLISAVVTARVFGAEVVGALALVTVLTGALHLISNVQELGGLVRELTRYAPGASEPRALMWATLTFSAVLTTAILVPFAALAVWLLYDVFEQPELLAAFAALAASYVLLDNSSANIEAPLAAYRDGRSIWLTHVAVTVTMSLAALVCAAFGVDDLTGLVGCTIVASAVGLAARVRATRRLIGLRTSRHDVERALGRMRSVLGFGIRAAPVNLTETAIGYADTIVLGANAPLDAIGAYSRAYGLYIRLGQIPVSLSRLYFPTMSSLHHRGDVAAMTRVHRLATRYLLLVIAPIATWLAACAPQVLAVFGPGFDQGATALGVLVFVAVLDCVARPAGGALWAADRPGVVSIVYGNVAAINVVLCLLLVPDHGLTGAAVANLAGWLVAAIALPLLAARELARPRMAMFDAGYVARLAAACGVIAVVAVPLRSLDGALAWQAFAAGPALLAGLVVFRPLARVDGQTVERALDAARLESPRLRRALRALHRVASHGRDS
jgi:O-antigen/teichoic acid export membrane protein